MLLPLASLLLALLLVLATEEAGAIDLCALLGICNNNNNNNNHNNGRDFPNQQHFRPEWVDHGGKSYYFGVDAGPMDWWDADRLLLHH